MHTVTVNNKALKLPSTWTELTPRQFRAVSAFLYPHTISNQVKAFLALSGKARFFRKIFKRLGEEDDRGLQILQLTDWLYQKKEVVLSTSPDTPTFRPLLDKFRMRMKRHHLPEADLGDVSLDEWAFAVYYYQQYLTAKTMKQKKELLDKMVATICRPLKSKTEREAQGFDGYPRIAFNKNLIESRAKRIKVPHYVYTAVVDYISMGNEYLRLQYAALFEGEASEGPNFGWEGAKWNLAENGGYGKADEVAIMGIHQVCIILLKKKLENEKKDDK